MVRVFLFFIVFLAFLLLQAIILHEIIRSAVYEAISEAKRELLRL